MISQDGFWMVGDVPGVNSGGIINYNTGKCPEGAASNLETSRTIIIIVLT